MLNEFDLAALSVTLKLASVSTLILLVVGTPLAWWLAHSKWRLKSLIEALIALPLILPPTVWANPRTAAVTNPVRASGIATEKNRSTGVARSVAATSIGREPIAEKAFCRGCTTNGIE